MFFGSYPVVKPWWKRCPSLLAWIGILALSTLPAKGDIYVGTNLSGALYGTISAYDNSGALLTPVVASGFAIYGPQALAVSGSHLFVASGNVGANGVIGKYTTSGTVVDATLITGLTGPLGITVSDSFLYVTSYMSGTIGKYDLDGHPLNPSLVSGLIYGPTGIAVSDSHLYVCIAGTNSISEYTTSGDLVNQNFITGINYGPRDIVISGSHLYVGNPPNGTIAQYTTAGELVNGSLLMGLNSGNYTFAGLAVNGSSIYVTRPSTGGYAVSEYTTSGALVNASLIMGAGGPIVVTNVPEAASLTLLAGGTLALLIRRPRARPRPI